MRNTRPAVLVAAVAALFAAPAAFPASYVLISNNTFPADFSARIEAAGGRLSLMVPEIGLAIVESDNPDFRSAGARIAGVQDVARNITMKMIDPRTAPMVSFERRRA